MSPHVQTDVSLAPYTTFKTGGRARYISIVTSIAELKAVVAFAQANQLRLFVLGGGSNVLVSDEGFDGLVIKIELKGRTYETVSEGKVIATFGAGEVFDEVVAETTQRGLWGLENLSHIPGTVGATPVQNVGAYGVEVADIIRHVTALNIFTNEIETLDTTVCAFSYRDSIFKRARELTYIILSVTVTLSSIAQPKLTYGDLTLLASRSNLSPQIIRLKVIEIRSTKFPDWTTVGTAGSFFKNPIVPAAHALPLLAMYPELPVYPVSNGNVKLALGFMLDKICGLKGYTKNHLALYEKQALVVVATEGATTSEVLRFTDEVIQKVFEKTNISVEREVTFIK